MLKPERMLMLGCIEGAEAAQAYAGKIPSQGHWIGQQGLVAFGGVIEPPARVHFCISSCRERVRVQPALQAG